MQFKGDLARGGHMGREKVMINIAALTISGVRYERG